MPKINKLLVANRGEIAIRVFRSAHELGIRTVAIYSHEDRFALHRLQGRRGLSRRQAGRADPQLPQHRRRSSPSRRRRRSTRSIRATASSPRTPSFARACRDGGHHLRRPAPRAARAARRQGRRPQASPSEAGVPVLSAAATSRSMPGPRRTKLADAARLSRSSSRRRWAAAAAACASSQTADELDDALDQARREAGTAFGVPDVFLEKFIRRAKHIEVQLLGDQHGNLVHLFERDCSVQRRHQKVVEIAPALNLDPALRAGDLRRRARDRPRASATTTPAPSSSWSTSTPASSTSSRSTRASRSSTPSPRSSPAIDLVKSQILIAQGAPLSDPEIGLPDQDDGPHARLRLPVPDHDRGPGEQVHARLRPDHATTARPAAWASGSTAARRSPARSSRRSTTRCW